MNRYTDLLGAHISIAGGLESALDTAYKINATTLQLFTSSQLQWRGRVITKEEAKRFIDKKKKYNFSSLMSHASYLVNLGSPRVEVRGKSIQSFREEIIRCQQLEISFLNFHPGAALDSSRESCLDAIVEALLSFSDLLKDGKLRLLIENMAGQGSQVGATFKELNYILERASSEIPIGVCLDSCHAFASGYDFSSEESFDKTFNLFEKEVGLKNLFALHLNDSLHELGSRKDRHAQLGMGKIGWEAFRLFVNKEQTKAIPKYLETPGGVELWESEIKQLRNLVE